MTRPVSSPPSGGSTQARAHELIIKINALCRVLSPASQLDPFSLAPLVVVVGGRSRLVSLYKGEITA